MLKTERALVVGGNGDLFGTGDAGEMLFVPGVSLDDAPGVGQELDGSWMNESGRMRRLLDRSLRA
jgi:hypothetical protein